MNVYEYVAVNNPYGAKSVIEDYGMKAVPNNKVLAKQLAALVSKYKDDALNKIAHIHPDLPLFQAQFDELKARYENDSKQKDVSHFANIDGQTIKSDIASIKDRISMSNDKGVDHSKHRQELLIIGAIMVIGLAIIFKK